MLLEKGADVTASNNVSIIINYTPIVIVHVYPFEWVDHQSNRMCCISHTVCVHVHVHVYCTVSLYGKHFY